MPPDFFVYGLLQALGRRGVVDRMAALLVGRPKTPDYVRFRFVEDV